MRRARSGLSLLESVLLLALLSLVLVLTASLLVDLAKVERRADELSWKVTALSILERIELDGHGALQTNLSPGESGPHLSFTLADVEHPDFLPDGPPASWSPGQPSVRKEVAFFLQGSSLKRSVTGLRNHSASLGEVDRFEAERAPEGHFVVTLGKRKESLRKEFGSFCLRSLAGPP